jgi:hypothetical protein
MGWFSRDAPTHFPPVEGVRLDGTEVALPADLPADATVLVVSFRDDLDALADQWARLVERLAAEHDGRVAVWELPVMGRAMRHLGEVGTLSVRGQVDDETERARTVPIYVDKKDFRTALGLRGSNEVTAFLVDRLGAIAWTGEGDIDMDEVTALEAALTDVLGRVQRLDGSEVQGLDGTEGRASDEPLSLEP